MSVKNSYEYVELGEVPTHSSTTLSVRITKHGQIRLNAIQPGGNPYGWILTEEDAATLGGYLTRAAATRADVAVAFEQRQQQGEELDMAMEERIIEIMEDTK